MEFSRQEQWSGKPFPSPWDLPNPGIKPGSPELQEDFFLPSEPPGKPLDVPQFVYSSPTGHVGCFQVLMIMNEAAISISTSGFCVDVSFQPLLITRRVVARLYGESISFVRNHRSGCAILHSHHQWMRILAAPHPHQHSELSSFQILAILVGVFWYLIAFICILLMTYDLNIFSYAYWPSVNLLW